MADRSVLHSSECLSMRHRTLPGYARAMKLLLWCCCIAQCLPVCRSMRQMMKFPTCIRHSNGIRAAGVSGWVVYIYMQTQAGAGQGIVIVVGTKFIAKLTYFWNLLYNCILVFCCSTHIFNQPVRVSICVWEGRGGFTADRCSAQVDTQTHKPTTSILIAPRNI